MVIVMGTVRVDPDAIERLRPAMEAMMAASRAEDGCLTYAYALDLLEPGLVRVSELWTDRAALEAHFKTAHMATWRTALAGQIRERDIKLYDSSEGEAF
ncbi:antibiotic biosynthesis monooxygenase [Caulobacter sp. SLTY]|uniref:putative quinol monooxygenase n=1 Tax=Caulobacter sp. SLTY TaxID=2683262 RepID=UPI0014125AA8|nr:putative quinol monooxygenase [Caulobacter sp. SLTY]NBB16108.1 antibiotic biosynthesis monooxygenase [Caulobacter sp. SLTY]